MRVRDLVDVADAVSVAVGVMPLDLVDVDVCVRVEVDEDEDVSEREAETVDVAVEVAVNEREGATVVVDVAEDVRVLVEVSVGVVSGATCAEMASQSTPETPSAPIPFTETLRESLIKPEMPQPVPHWFCSGSSCGRCGVAAMGLQRPWSSLAIPGR